MKTYTGGERKAETIKLYRNRHDGTFEDVTNQVGLDKVYMPMGDNFGDIDNDGYSRHLPGHGIAFLYCNASPCAAAERDQGKTFVRCHCIFRHRRIAQGTCYRVRRSNPARQRRHFGSDRRRGSRRQATTMRVFANPGNHNNWLNVRLVGVKTNREALGAQIHVTVRDGHSPPRSIYRTVGQTSSFGANPVEQNIGLGPGAHEVTLDIWWPTSKTRQHFTGVAVNQFIQIKEFATEYTHRDLHPFDFPKPGPSAAASLSH